MVGRQAHAPVVPRRARVPLVGEDQPVGGHERSRPQGEPGRAPHLLAELAVDRVGDVRLTALEHGQARHRVRDRLEDEALHARRLAPVPLERLEHQLDARRERDEPVRAGPDRRLLEAVLAHLLDVLPGDDPRGARRRRAVEGHEVRPRLLETEPDAPGIRSLDRGDLLLEHLRRDAAVPLERELDVVGRDGLAVVERRPSAQHELVDEPVGRRAPRLGQAGRHGLLGHRLHEGVVERVEDHEGRDEARRLGGLEEGRRQAEVKRPGHLPCRRFRGEDRRGSDRHQGEDESRNQARASARHREASLARGLGTRRRDGRVAARPP